MNRFNNSGPELKQEKIVNQCYQHTPPDPPQPLIWTSSNTRLLFFMLCQMNTAICVHETDSRGKYCPRRGCALQPMLTTLASAFP